MSGELSTLDLGNSRWKLRRWEAGAERIAARLDLSGPVPARLRELEAFLREGAGRPQRFALSSVVGPSLERELVLLLERHGQVLAPDPGLENRCREPERVGRDRLFAARGALALVGRSCLVVDAGTALTVDAVLFRPASRGVFLGGAIAPGPELLAASLAAGAARLPRIEPRPGARFLGQATEEALASGVALGFRGAARELARGVADEAGLAGAAVVLTGGAHRFLLEPDSVFEPAPVVHDDLVHLGLRRAALEPAGVRRAVP